MISSREWSQQFETIKRQIQIKRAGCDLKLSEVQPAFIERTHVHRHMSHDIRVAAKTLNVLSSWTATLLIDIIRDSSF